MGNVWRALNDPQLPKNYFRIETTILRSLGIELIHEESFLYGIYSKITLFIIVIVFTSTEIYDIWAHWGQLDLMLVVMSYLVTHITGVIKTGILYFNRKKIGGFIKQFHTPPFAPNELRGDKEEEALVRLVVKKTEWQLIIYFIVISGTIFGGIIIVTYERFFVNKPKEERTYPYSPIAFVDVTKTPNYEIACFLQFLGVLLFALIIATTYVLLSSIIGHISVQLAIVGNSFRNLRIRAKKMQEMHKDPTKNEDFYIKIAFKDSLTHHLDILELHAQVEALICYMILVVFFCSVGLLVFTLYNATLFPVGSPIFLQNCCFWMIIVCQVGMYCYWGNELSLESENVAKAAFEADWIEAPQEVRNGLIMVIRRSQKSLIVTAGKFLPLDMPTFMSIIKGSGSYFMVLRQRKDEQISLN